MMDRRLFLAATSGSIALGAVAQRAETLKVDPVAKAYNRFVENRSAFKAVVESDPERHGNFDTPECVSLDEEKEELERIITGQVPTSMQGALAQVEWLERDLEYFSSCGVHNEVIHKTAAFLRALAA